MNNSVNNKRKNFSCIILCFVILLSSNYSFAQHQAKFVTINYNDKEYLVVSDIVCLDIKENFYNKELFDRIEKSGYEIISTREKHHKILLRTDGKSDILEHYYKFEKEEYVENVLPYVAVTGYYTPNDPRYSPSQNPYQWYLHKINMSQAWDLTKGSDTLKIGVLDSGIPMQNGNLSHIEFPNNGRILLGLNYIVIPPNNNVADDHGHGTHVDGVIAAQTNNNEGIAGICFNSKLYISKVLDNNNNGTFEGVVNGIRNAVDNGCKIINLSLGSLSDPYLDLFYACAYASDRGVLIVAAAGNNDGAVVNYPAKYAATYPNVIAVSAINRNDQIASFSNFGSEISICAPGDSIYSTMPNYNYGNMSGTSMAAPMVSGVAGLVKSKFPHYTATEIRKQIELSADYLQTWSLSDTIFYGAGRVNAYNSVKNL
jgi:thermitase